MKKMDHKIRFNIWYVFIALWGVILLHNLWLQATRIEQIPYSQFQAYLDEDLIEEIRITNNYIQGTLRQPLEGQPQQFVTIRVEPDLADKLASSGIRFAGEIETDLSARFPVVDCPGPAVCRHLAVLHAPLCPKTRLGRRLHVDRQEQGQGLHGAGCQGHLQRRGRVWTRPRPNSRR